eukprot:768271-Hanusia_phi.AAC.3
MQALKEAERSEGTSETSERRTQGSSLREEDSVVPRFDYRDPNRQRELVRSVMDKPTEAAKSLAQQEQGLPNSQPERQPNKNDKKVLVSSDSESESEEEVKSFLHLVQKVVKWDMQEIEGLGTRTAVRLPAVAGAEYSDVKDQISSLPLLMQYETLQQLKDERRATNRSVFAAVRDTPEAYSSLQIQVRKLQFDRIEASISHFYLCNYLKTTSINSHIESVRAHLAGSHVMVTEDGQKVPAK